MPGYEAPVNLVYSPAQPVSRSAHPDVLDQSESVRSGSSSAAPIRAATRTSRSRRWCIAGLDGIQNRIEPPDPVDKDLYDLSPEDLAAVPQVPGSLEEALNDLEADQDFLKAGGVFTDDLIETWIAYKRENEVDALRLRPHPYEFHLYYDI